MSNDKTPVATGTPEIAFYYPNPFWYSGEWVKNLILFFDGIALLVPKYMKDQLEWSDPSIATGLREHGLLHILEPETLVDQRATENLAKALADVIASGALDGLARDGTIRFAELSYSRLGGYGAPGLAKKILEDLKARGLAHDTRDGVSIPMHPTVRSLVLVLLAQILRPYGETLGLDLAPATDRLDIVRALEKLLSLPGAPSAGHVVSFDLAAVGVDLAPIPMDEILDFRRQYASEYKAYARKVRQFVRELGALSEQERQEAFNDRQEELNELARNLSQVSIRAWRRPVSFALTLMGASWTAVTGDAIGAILGGASGLLGLGSASKVDVGAYSYLFKTLEFAR